MKFQIILDILLLVGVIYLFSMCDTNESSIFNDKYDINYYIDTIDNHIILTTVVDSKHTNNVSCSSIELK